jgi:hypothetical protein
MEEVEISENQVFLALEIAIAHQAKWEQEHGYTGKSSLLASWEAVRNAYLFDNKRIKVRHDGRAF